MFKRFVKLLNISIVCFLLLNENAVVQAIDSSEFKLVNLSQEDINRIWNNVDFQIIPEGENIKIFSDPIVSFDVSKSQNIIVGLNNKQLILLNKNNKLLYHYKFNSSGSFYVQWKGENILLFLVRSSIIIEISPDGQLISMIETDNHVVNNNRLWRQVANQRTVNINNCEYSIKNDMGILNLFACQTYSQLVATDEFGNSTIVYNVSDVQKMKIIGIMVVALIVFCVNVYNSNMAINY